MNLLNKQAVSPGGDKNAGAVAFGGPQQAAPANFQVGAVGFGPCWQDDEPSLREMYDRACQTIVRLECEAEELRAEVALLTEQARILASERDEAGASPHFKQPPQEALADADNTPETLSCVAWATDVTGWPTYLVVNSLVAQKLERERDEARIQYRSTEALGMALVETIGEMKSERVDDRLKLADWRDCAKRLAAAVEHYYVDLRDETEGGWSEERAAIALFDELECQHQVKRDEACRESCRDKAAADGGWANI